MNRRIRLIAAVLFFSQTAFPAGVYAAPPTPAELLKEVEKAERRGVKKIKKGAKRAAHTVTKTVNSTFSGVEKCLASGGGAGAAGMAAKFHGNPKAFTRDLFREIASTMHSGFPHVMRAQLDALRDGRAHSPEDAVRRSIASVNHLAERHPGGKCLVPLMKKHEKAVEEAALELKEDLHHRFQDSFDKHVAPALHDAIGKGLARLITGKNDGLLLTERELKAVVSGVYAKYLVQQLEQGTRDVGRVEKAAAGADRAPALAALQATLSPQAQWPEYFRLELGLAIVRAMGHKYINSNKPGHGGYLVNEAVGIIQLSQGSVEKLTSAVCGLIPEAGAAICGLAEGAVDALWNQGLVPLICYGAKQGLHAALDAEMDFSERSLKSGKTLDELKKKSGPLDGISTMLSKDLVNSIADKNLKEIRAALNGFNSSVLGLAKSGGR